MSVTEERDSESVEIIIYSTSRRGAPTRCGQTMAGRRRSRRYLSARFPTWKSRNSRSCKENKTKARQACTKPKISVSEVPEASSRWSADGQPGSAPEFQVQRTFSSKDDDVRCPCPLWGRTLKNRAVDVLVSKEKLLSVRLDFHR